MTGTTFGTWILGPEVGRGPLGVVYRATDAHTADRVAAVKVLTAEFARTPDFLARFPGEMLPLQQLRHPHIARYYDCGVQNGTAYYASEFIDGTDLAGLLKTAKREDAGPGLGWKPVAAMAAQLAQALKHGHHRSTLHRDLKPGNVRTTADGLVKLTDFGLAKVVCPPPLALPPDPFGTAGFLAPEHFTGKPFTRRSDLYSLGCVLYAAAAGRPPYTAATVAEFMHKHCYVLPDRPMQFDPKMPPELDELICALLHKDPSRRPPSAAAVLGHLEHLRGKAERKGDLVTWPNAGLEPAAPVSSEDWADRTEVDRPRPLLSRPWVVIPLCLLALGVALILFFWPRPTAEELFARARPLIESNDPDQWQRAMDEYLTPLSDRFPDQYADEIKAVRTRLRDHRGLRRAMEDGARFHPQSEAERLYARGLALLQSGDSTAARRVWEGLARLYADAKNEQRWVELATTGAAELDRRGTTDDAGRLAAIEAAAERAKGLTADEAAALFDVLEQVYADDPAALAAVRKLRKK